MAKSTPNGGCFFTDSQESNPAVPIGGSPPPSLAQSAPAGCCSSAPGETTVSTEKYGDLRGIYGDHYGRMSWIYNYSWAIVGDIYSIYIYICKWISHYYAIISNLLVIYVSHYFSLAELHLSKSGIWRTMPGLKQTWDFNRQKLVDFGCRANEKQKKTMIHSLFLEGFFS